MLWRLYAEDWVFRKHILMSAEEIAVYPRLVVLIYLPSRFLHLSVEQAVGLRLGQIKDFKLREVSFGYLAAATVHQVIELVFEILNRHVLILALLK